MIASLATLKINSRGIYRVNSIINATTDENRNMIINQFIVDYNDYMNRKTICKNDNDMQVEFIYKDHINRYDFI